MTSVVMDEFPINAQIYTCRDLGAGEAGASSLSRSEPLPTRAHTVAEECSERPLARRTLQHCLDMLAGQTQRC